ncbi:MAG: hypothetical protein LCH56_03400 [Proteobacteria bacterium]|nr:hypothetical protein [Pseudomonadota bacterium]
MKPEEEFECRGFLADAVAGATQHLRAENAGWFELAEALNLSLMAVIMRGMGSARRGNWDADAVGVRILLRVSGMLQGVVLLAERGMIAEARTLTRSAVESVLHVGALHEQGAAYIEMLKADSEASRKRQGKFILAEGLLTDGDPRNKLEAAITEIESAKPINLKDVASLSPFAKEYLAYQRLSDDAAHLTGKSLNRYIRVAGDRSGWSYAIGQGEPAEIAATLHHVVRAGLAVGVAVTSLLKDQAGNAELAALSERYGKMPEVPPV